MQNCVCGSTPPTRVSSNIYHTARLFLGFVFKTIVGTTPVTLESTSRTEIIERTSEEDEEEGRTRPVLTLLRNLRPPRGGRQDLSSTAMMALTTTEAGEGATGSRELALGAPEAGAVRSWGGSDMVRHRPDRE